MEILALYKRPRVFLLDLEKKLNVIKEEFSKKQVEIREVNLKKFSSKSISTNGMQFFEVLCPLIVFSCFLDAPTITLSPASGEKKGEAGKGSSASPAALPSQSKLQPSPLSQSAAHKNSPLLNSISPNPPSAPITNGSKLKDSPRASTSNSAPRTSSPSSCPPAPKRRKFSSSPEQSSSHDPKKGSGERAKPIISPIHFEDPFRTSARVSDDSNSGSSQDNSSPRENGVVPKQYRGDFTKHRTRKQHHGHSRRHHRDHTTTASAAASNSRHERHHHHHSREPEGLGRNSRRDHHRSSKRRKTELERYR